MQLEFMSICPQLRLARKQVDRCIHFMLGLCYVRCVVIGGRYFSHFANYRLSWIMDLSFVVNNKGVKSLAQSSG